MGSTAVVESFDSVDAYARHPGSFQQGRQIFSLPRWIQTWRQAFEVEDTLHICLVKIDDELIGVAPLSIDGATASFVGDPEICDYFDFSVAPGYEEEFYNALLDDLSKRRVTKLDLRCLRPESTVFPYLIDAAGKRGAACSTEPDGVSVEIDLPGDWHEYLYMLDGRQRHEVRRKLRRLREKAAIQFLALDDTEEIMGRLDAFLKMFRESRSDKAAFMHPRMELFFRSMIRAMSEENVLRLFILNLNDSPAAAALCFDYEGSIHLYNSGYDPQYKSLSVGLVCKILSIKHGIEAGKKRYDFLKGAEPYKRRLGGEEVQLSRCRVALS